MHERNVTLHRAENRGTMQALLLRALELATAGENASWCTYAAVKLGHMHMVEPLAKQSCRWWVRRANIVDCCTMLWALAKVSHEQLHADVAVQYQNRIKSLLATHLPDAASTGSVAPKQSDSPDGPERHPFHSLQPRLASRPSRSFEFRKPELDGYTVPADIEGGSYKQGAAHNEAWQTLQPWTTAVEIDAAHVGAVGPDADARVMLRWRRSGVRAATRESQRPRLFDRGRRDLMHRGAAVLGPGAGADTVPDVTVALGASRRAAAATNYSRVAGQGFENGDKGGTGAVSVEDGSSERLGGAPAAAPRIAAVGSPANKRGQAISTLDAVSRSSVVAVGDDDAAIQRAWSGKEPGGGGASDAAKHGAHVVLDEGVARASHDLPGSPATSGQPASIAVGGGNGSGSLCAWDAAVVGSGVARACAAGAAPGSSSTIRGGAPADARGAATAAAGVGSAADTSVQAVGDEPEPGAQQHGQSISPSYTSAGELWRPVATAANEASRGQAYNYEEVGGEVQLAGLRALTDKRTQRERVRGARGEHGAAHADRVWVTPRREARLAELALQERPWVLPQIAWALATLCDRGCHVRRDIMSFILTTVECALLLRLLAIIMSPFATSNLLVCLACSSYSETRRRCVRSRCRTCTSAVPQHNPGRLAC